MTESSDVKLSITSIKPSDIPSEDAIFKAADSIIESCTTWKQGKTYHKVVKTYLRAKGADDGAPWHCRVSVHKPDEATFDQMWEKLGKDKANNEKQFIPDIHKVTKVKEISPNQAIWTLYYKFPPPVSPRVFTELQITRVSEEKPRTGIVISMPIDLSSPEDTELAKMEEKGVRGRYVSIERIVEQEDGSTEWRMATSSTPGGSIPSWLAEGTMASKISDDVPHFMKWLRSLPKTETSA
ncbi:hypothetical protein FB446DRAFT_527430 [Lentinula raphanica]|uniref:DUF3074 domain-containing protein n=1 Tax=Lentinula raphanica TaxID=153919 RepID=A0AA38UFG3_9AGAR|nr:hypothetical protein FB446DRAFT_527430 [Lentinula raphanica]KAJ3826621.1 hypothetical protein F5880DRAFT_59544 [Lentinula raphanica]KAJ3839847.1 hypothetical protein F5878DRAFT_615054 [Lentinula raphanica]